MGLFDIVLSWRDCRKIALVKGDKSIKYEELYRLVCGNRILLEASGIVGRNVILREDDPIQYVVCFWSLLLAGNVVAPAHSRSSFEVLVCDASSVDADWIVFSNKASLCKFDARRGELGLLVADSFGRLSVEKKPSFSAFHRNAPDTFLLVSTSGTSGFRKRAMLSYDNIFSNIIGQIETMSLDSEDVVLIVMPMSFISGNTSQMFLHLFLGGVLVFYDYPVFFAERFVELVKRWRVTVFSCVPHCLRVLARLNNYNPDEIISLKYISSVGEPILVSTIERVQNLMGEVPVVQMYGLTEASPRVTALKSRYSREKIGSVGSAIPGMDVKIFESEVYVRGAAVFLGYYGCRRSSEEVLVNGWLRTGDVGYIDDDGFLYIKGRKKNIVIRNGVNVCVEEIENRINACGLFTQVLVCPERSSDSMIELVAYLVLENGGELAASEVRQIFRRNLPGWMWPDKFLFKNKLETTLTEKIKR